MKKTILIMKVGFWVENKADVISSAVKLQKGLSFTSMKVVL